MGIQSRCIDETGNRYGRLLVIEFAGKDKSDRTLWKCLCDCGKTHVVRGYHLRSGATRSCGCLRVKGEIGSPGWCPGTKKSGSGYMMVKDREHPNAYKSGYVLEHVFVMSTHLGRPLKKDEVVHHKNGIRDDNRIENLELCTINNHPPGQRVTDLVLWAKEILKEYTPNRVPTKTVQYKHWKRNGVI